MLISFNGLAFILLFECFYHWLNLSAACIGDLQVCTCVGMGSIVPFQLGVCKRTSLHSTTGLKLDECFDPLSIQIGSVELVHQIKTFLNTDLTCARFSSCCPIILQIQLFAHITSRLWQQQNEKREIEGVHSGLKPYPIW